MRLLDPHQIDRPKQRTLRADRRRHAAKRPGLVGQTKPQNRAKGRRNMRHAHQPTPAATSAASRTTPRPIDGLNAPVTAPNPARDGARPGSPRAPANSPMPPQQQALLLLQRPVACLRPSIADARTRRRREPPHQLPRRAQRRQDSRGSWRVRSRHAVRVADLSGLRQPPTIRIPGGPAMLTLTGNGRLTRDPQLRTTHSGKTVATISVASDRRDRTADAIHVDLIVWEAQATAAAAAPRQGPGRQLHRPLRAARIHHPGRRPAHRTRAARRRPRVRRQAA